MTKVNLKQLLSTSSLILAAAIFFGLFITLLLAAKNTSYQHIIIQNNQFRLAFVIGIDNLGRLMSLFILTISAMIYTYAYNYLKSDSRRPIFLLQFLFVVLSSLLLALSQNLVTAFISWQFIGINLYFLLNYYHSDSQANRSAKKKFVINRLGDCTFLTAIIIAMQAHHSTNFNALMHTHQSALIASLLFISVLTKCAQFPFHIWLLDTMEAPTPVSALMHAGIINSGGILLTRVSHLIIQNKTLLIFMLCTSLVTIMMTSYWKKKQPDVKKQLAYSTSSQMGYMIMQCSVGAFPAAILHLITHGFFKASLFLNAGDTLRQEQTDHSICEPLALSTKWGIGFAIFIGLYLLTMIFNLKLPIIIAALIGITIYSSITIALIEYQDRKTQLLLISLSIFLTTIYIGLLKLISTYLSQYTFFHQPINNSIQGIGIFALLLFWYFTHKTNTHCSIADKTEYYFRKYLLNPIRSVGESITIVLEKKIIALFTITLILIFLFTALLININLFIVPTWVSKASTLTLLALNIIILLAANRAHSMKKMVNMLLLYQLIFITYALLHQSKFIDSIIIYHIINIGLVMIMLFYISDNQSVTPKHYLTATLLLLIGIPGTASFISELYLLDTMFQLGVTYTTLYLFGILLLSITIMHALQLYSFGKQQAKTGNAKRKYLIFFLVIASVNIILGISPNLLLNII